MQEAFKIFVIATIAITLWTAFLLLKDRKSHASLNRWLAAFLILFIIPQLDTYVALTAQQPLYLMYVSAYSFLWFKGPFVWVFTGFLTRRKTSLVKTLPHFIPWLGIFISIWYLPEIAPTTQLFGLCHMLIYLSLAVVTLVRKRTYIQNIWTGFQNSALYWLLYIVGGLMSLMIIDLVVISMIQLTLLSSYKFIDFFAFPFFSIYVLSLAILSVYRPEILFREVVKENTLDSSNNSKTFISAETEKASERYLELDSALAKPLLDQLTQLMQKQQMFRQNDLSLKDLASSLGISLHQVSELLNVHQGINFYEFVNQYRVQFACERLKDSSCHLRVLDIAFDAGFNNKNSFYRAFKDSLGITPNQYRENYFKSPSL